MTQDEFDEIGWKKGQDIVVDGHSGLTSYLALAVDFRDRMVLAEIGAGVSWVPCADIISPLDRPKLKGEESYWRSLVAVALPAVISKGERRGWDAEFIAREAISYADLVIAEEKRSL